MNLIKIHKYIIFSIISISLLLSAEKRNENLGTGYDFDANDIGLDIGPESCINFDMYIKTSKTIMWNGPMGISEMELLKV